METSSPILCACIILPKVNKIVAMCEMISYQVCQPLLDNILNSDSTSQVVFSLAGINKDTRTKTKKLCSTIHLFPQTGITTNVCVQQNLLIIRTRIITKNPDRCKQLVIKDMDLTGVKGNIFSPDLKNFWTVTDTLKAHFTTNP